MSGVLLLKVPLRSSGGRTLRQFGSGSPICLPFASAPTKRCTQMAFFPSSKSLDLHVWHTISYSASPSPLQKKAGIVLRLPWGWAGNGNF